VKDILVVVSTNRGIDRQTEECINPLVLERAEMIKQMGTSDVALARNIALTQAWNVLASHKNLKTVLMIDDDMVFSKEDAYRVVKKSQDENVPVAGAFITQRGALAAKPWSKTMWQTGLAFLAIPADMLIDVAKRSKTVNTGEEVVVFTWSGEENGEWVPEDYRLCRRLGGVKILPVSIGHLKMTALYPPSEEEMETFLAKTLESYKQ
jgi:predicted small secreted protein